MRNCTQCNQPVEAKDERCPACGAELKDLPPVDHGSLEESVLALMQRGEKIQAIKIYLEQTGVGLAEAKAAVEQIERTGPGPAAPPMAADLEKQVLELLAEDNKIGAIKVYREQTGVGLKEAKDAVEAFAARHGIAPGRAGCFGVLVLVLAAALAGTTWIGV